MTCGDCKKCYKYAGKLKCSESGKEVKDYYYCDVFNGWEAK